MANENYIIPLGIDVDPIIKGLAEVDDSLSALTKNARTAGTSISDLMAKSGQSTDNLTTKINAGATAAKSMQEAAKKAGTDIEKAFSPDNVKTGEIQTKVATFVAKLKDAIGKPVDFKFNFDQTKINLMVTELGKAKTQVEFLEQVLESAKAGLGDFVKGSDPFNELQKQIAEADKFLNVLREDVIETQEVISQTQGGGAVEQVGEAAEEAAPRVKTLKQELRQITEQLAQMSLAGQEGTAEFASLSARAGELNDTIADTRQRISEIGSDTKGIDAGISAIKGLAGAFAVGQGALAAFGAENEDVALAIQKVQGAMAILQGVQEVANVLNKDSALLVYLQTLATNTQTAALAGETVALEAEAAATATATAATNSFTLALLKNPIVLVIAALVAGAVALYEFTKSEEKAGISVDELNEKLKEQETLLKGDTAIIARRAAIDEAEAEAARKRQSEILSLKIASLEKQQQLDERDLDLRKILLDKLKVTDKESAAEYDKQAERISEIEENSKEQINQIKILKIQLDRQRADEENKIALDRYNEKVAQSLAEKAILKEAADYAQQLQELRISELKDGQQKEIQELELSTAAKLRSLKEEQAARIEALNVQRNLLKFDLDINKDLKAQKLKDIDKQIQLEMGAERELGELTIEIVEATEKNKLEVIKKYNQQRESVEFDVSQTLLSIKKQTAANEEEILRTSAERKITVLNQSNQTEYEKNIQSAAILQKLDSDIAASNLDYALAQIDLDKTKGETILMQQKGFFDKSRDGQALANLLLLDLQIQADKRKLAELEKAGKDESDQQVINIKKAIAAAEGARDAAAKDIKPLDLFEILFPGDAGAQGRAKLFVEGIGKVFEAVDSYYSMQVEAQQRYIDAQKKVVAEDDAALKTLSDRLKEEQALKEKGYANNVKGIEAEITAKNKKRAEDVQKQKEYQKQMEELKRQQLIAQTALQASNLILASTQILVQATSTLGPYGAIIGAGLVAAMIAGFVIEKAAAFSAVGQPTQFAEGGMIGGKSHREGGQKYYAADGSGQVMELERDEYVVRKEQTKKYFPLLDALNKNKLSSVPANMLLELLENTGVHLTNDSQHDEAIRESRQHTSMQIVNNTTIKATGTKELQSIDKGIEKINKHNASQVITYIEGEYLITKKGNKTTKTKI